MTDLAETQTSDLGPRTFDLSKWQFWIDRGGTFTDIIAYGPSGRLVSRKLLSEDPNRYEDAALEGIRRILMAETGGFDLGRIASVRMGSTVATNALLEGTGEPTLLVITRGFGDALRIGYQERPDLFARHIVLPELPYKEVLEASERISAEGEVIEHLDEEHLRNGLTRAFDADLRAVAIAFMHGYRYPKHEARAAAIAREVGFKHVSTSHETAPLIKIISRGDTTVVDAHLTPVVQDYVQRLRTGLGDSRLLFMQSNGGLSEAERFRGKDAVLSGPAGGVIGMMEAGRKAGYTRLIGFDMGGTSTDVSLYDGRFERTDTFAIGGMRMRTQALDIHTVAAGGGSVLAFDGIRLRVAERSAGALPGPACYGRGGPLAVTDCHVQLGRLRPEFFPHVFGDQANQALDRGSVQSAFSRLAEQIRQETGAAKSSEELAADFLRIAVQKMAQAIRRISIERGHDPEDFVLVPFGGAAGQHACLVADQLGIKKILIDPLAGVLSARGIGSAAVSQVLRRTVEKRLTDRIIGDVETGFDELGKQLEHRFSDDAPELNFTRRLYLKYEGTDTSAAVPFAERSAMESALADFQRKRFGFDPADDDIIVEAIELEAVLQGHGQTPEISNHGGSGGKAEPVMMDDVWLDGQWRTTPFYRRTDLRLEQRVTGPAVIVEDNATTIVEPGWTAQVIRHADLLLTRTAELRHRQETGSDYDPTRLEIFNNLFRHIAEEMGVQLCQTARSVNIKERLDFSCALFDRHGDLVANAPHMPVHLGSMSETVRSLLDSRRGHIRPGDAYLTNDPYHGGTHLPDLTVVSPFFDKGSTTPLFFVASRAHHAEIGGVSPGSMPALSKHVDEEGVLFDDFGLMAKGRFNEAALRSRLLTASHPSRNADTNVADLKAQVAANQRGIVRLQEVVDNYGADTVEAYMRHVKANAAEAVRRALGSVSDGAFSLEMDTGQTIAVSVSIDHEERSAVIDFEGTSSQAENNLNAPRAITTAAVLYVMRMLVDNDIPLNAGCLDPIEIRVPEGSILNPTFPAAVAGGNVETSQCVVDALLAALGVMAASQGTMNNLTFGDAKDQYYETICGGSGAGPGFEGTSAVHTHMTNSRLTDPEILEMRYPVLLEAFSIRSGSGGGGRWQGGDGAIRRLRFLKSMKVSILSNRRKTRPFGLNGGEAAASGMNRIERVDGSIEELPARAGFEVAEGDVLVIETPGGGGNGVGRME